jgi:hypothetical protein
MTKKGEKHSEETKRKISESLKKANCDTRFKKGHTNYWLGKHLPQETKDKISAAHKGKTLSREHVDKVSQALKGRVRPKEVIEKIRSSNLGRKRSEETRKKMSDFQKARMQKPEERLKRSLQTKKYFESPEARKRASEMKRGEKSPTWKGGISFEPYCIKFTKEFRERVRAFFDYECVVCGVKQTTRKLHVHHVNYNKDTCCDNSPRLFVTLCMSCHSKTLLRREYWELYFTELIYNKYNGKCYIDSKTTPNVPIPNNGVI